MDLWEEVKQWVRPWVVIRWCWFGLAVVMWGVVVVVGLVAVVMRWVVVCGLAIRWLVTVLWCGVSRGIVWILWEHIKVWVVVWMVASEIIRSVIDCVALAISWDDWDRRRKSLVWIVVIWTLIWDVLQDHALCKRQDEGQDSAYFDSHWSLIFFIRAKRICFINLMSRVDS